jgi:DNA-binding NarL/FixJ family response regulator
MNWSDPKQCLEAVKQDGYALYYVKDQTPELCLEAIKQNINAKRYIKIPLTDELVYEIVTETI